MVTAHKIWQVGTTTLLLVISINLCMLGFFRPKLTLLEHTDPYETEYESDRKVIMVLFDALREDFVEFDSDTHLYLDAEADYAYHGKKLKYFKDLQEKEPHNTILLPFNS